MPVIATRRFEFDAAHRLQYHDGKCARLHGHRYVVDLSLASNGVVPTGPETGMVRDFSRFDDWLKATIGSWDHRTLLITTDPLHDVLAESEPDSLVSLEFMPTAEMMAAYVGVAASAALDSRDVWVAEVRVQETPNGWATWTRS